MSKDLLLYENGSGGELLLKNSDAALTDALYQQAYLCMFGGNIESNTKGNETSTENRSDWWGNSLIFKNKPEKQFNSNTERTLKNVVLNTSGRIDIKRAVISDLKYLSEFSNILVEVLLINEKDVEININIIKPNDLEDKKLQFIWDSAKSEIILEKTI